MDSVGKSTFINSIVNYMSFESMDAANGRPICLIPGERPPNVDIPYNKNTVYCFDCESFRYLVASVPPNNIQFDPKYKSSYVESWKISVNECKRLFERIIQLTPHKVMDTLSVNDTKQIIQMLTKPLADITKNIADNINQCQRHSVGIKQSSGTIKELRHKLYIPSVEIITTPLDRPKTVCGDGQCCKRHITNEITQINYTTECHSPCYLDFSDGNIVGNKGLLRCKAFNKYSGTDRNPYWSKPSFSRSLSDKFMSIFISSTTCQKCGHSYQKHLHLYYETESKVTKVTDQVINNKLVSAQLAAEAKELQIRRLDQRIVDLNAESETIVQSMSMFACFLANNALTPVNDAFGDYVRHLIANERHGPPGAQNQATIARFEQLLAQYDSQYQIISNAMHSPSGGHNITAKMVNE
ncbi:unnamed protein product [Medioppia subpectinata]|uniref:DUF8206 domain-containing protein n=1 Tax=Medioppia subpectinata TaxID=1979941 RepID=A0A7R9KN12_9ACAR|nr:unnamed protein product [Medioppia subpectinata]CAG2105289.1 unnamed protein product [Medioppia subpectinata]